MSQDEPGVVGDLGEHALIERVVGKFGSPPTDEVWSGDDTAAFGEGLLLTTDLMVEDVDFRLSYASGFDVGWKLVAANTSDIAAMGGRPWRAVAGVALRPDTSVEFVDSLAEGLASACREWNIGLVGGDFSSGREISATLALLGRAHERGPVLRRGAKVGDALCVTGALGGAAGGLLALNGEDAPGAELAALIERQLRPRARVAEGEALAGLVTAMIDISDGLAVDLGHLTDSSGVGCDVDIALIPVDPGLPRLASTDAAQSEALAITGGEDFELLFTIDEGHLDEAGAALAGTGTRSTRIGVITDGPARIGGRDLDEWRAQGWEHLRGR
ncbi:MAG: thiamine-phosphate kinase [Actinomycetota bacterium]|nr:thiamine-phosphate kinase [Actinomycetota bacterium]